MIMAAPITRFQLKDSFMKRIPRITPTNGMKYATREVRVDPTEFNKE
jgi:hypothetical protein